MVSYQWQNYFHVSAYYSVTQFIYLTSASYGLVNSEQNEHKTLSTWALSLPQVNLWKKLLYHYKLVNIN